MAFAKGKAFVILNRMAEKNQEASKLLNDLKQLEQSDFESRFGALLKSNPEFSEQSEPKEKTLNFNQSVETATAKEQIQPIKRKFNGRKYDSKISNRFDGKGWGQFEERNLGYQDPKINDIFELSLKDVQLYNMTAFDVDNSKNDWGSFNPGNFDDDKPWKIGLQTPDIPGEYGMSVKIHELAHYIDFARGKLNKMYHYEEDGVMIGGEVITTSDVIKNKLRDLTMGRLDEKGVPVETESAQKYLNYNFDMPKEAVEYIQGLKSKYVQIHEETKLMGEEIQKTMDSTFKVRREELKELEKNFNVEIKKYNDEIIDILDNFSDEKIVESSSYNRWADTKPTGKFTIPEEQMTPQQKERYAIYEEKVKKRDSFVNSVGYDIYRKSSALNGDIDELYKKEYAKLIEFNYTHPNINPGEKALSDIYSALVRNDTLNEEIGMKYVGHHSASYFESDPRNKFAEIWANYISIKAMKNPEYMDRLRKWEPKLVEALDYALEDTYNVFDKIVNKKVKTVRRA